MKSHYLVSLCFLFLISCSNKEMEIENATLKGEVESLKFLLSNCETRSNEIESYSKDLDGKILSLENELVSQSQTLNALNKSFSENDVVGSYEVNMKCISTTCSSTTLGDIRTEKWRVNKVGDNISITVYENENTDKKYQGNVRKRIISAVNPRTTTSFSLVSLEIGIDGQITGERVVYNGSCEIHYNLSIKRS